jgi:NDP-sugar pyrophosphorylase family protein
MKAVILAGGLGTRLRPFTEIIPKPLLPIGEKSVLEIQIDRLKESGFYEIFLATNYKSEYIENFLGDGSRYGVKLTISKETKPLGTVGPITLLREHLAEPFLVINGDVLTNFNFHKIYEFAVKNESVLTVGIKEIETPFRFGNIFYEGDYITGIQEKPFIKTKILAGIYVYKPGIFSLIRYNENLDLDVLITQMLSQGLMVGKYEIYDYWLDIGRMNDYEEAQNFYKNNFAKSE